MKLSNGKEKVRKTVIEYLLTSSTERIETVTKEREAIINYAERQHSSTRGSSVNGEAFNKSEGRGDKISAMLEMVYFAYCTYSNSLTGAEAH